MYHSVPLSKNRLSSLVLLAFIILSGYYTSSISAQNHISLERISYQDGEYRSSRLTEFVRNENETISTHYFKYNLNDDYRISVRSVDIEDKSSRYKYQSTERWDDIQENWIEEKSREMIFDKDKCEHQYTVSGRMASTELEEPVELTISYDNDCEEPWIDSTPPFVYDVDRLSSWTREKKESGSITTYTDYIEHVYSPTYTWETYREKIYIDGQLRKYTTTHTDWGYLEKVDYQYNEVGDISRVVFSNLSAPGGEWFRRDTAHFENKYFEGRLYEINIYHANDFSTKIETIQYSYDCTGRIVLQENFYKGTLNVKTIYGYEDEPNCPEKESFSVSLLNNPIGDQLTFTSNQDLENAQVYIFNVTGQVSMPYVININPYTYSVETDNYPPGLYILYIECMGISNTIKFLKA